MRQVISSFFGFQKLKKRNYILAVQITLFLIVFYIAFLALVQTRFWNELDLDVSLWISDNLQNPVLDTFSDVVNSSIGATFWINLGAILCIPKRTRKTGIILLAVVFIVNLFVQGMLKDIAARTRPWMYINLPSTGMPGGYSFPSGHSLCAFAAATVFAMADRRLGWITYPFAALIAFSRVYMFAHFASDVFVGAVIGAGVSFVICMLMTEGWKKIFDLDRDPPHPLPAPDPDDRDYGFHRLLEFRDEGYGTDRIYDWFQARKQRKQRRPGRS